MSDSPEQKPYEIAYPCIWIYALIGTNEQEMRQSVEEVMRGRNYRVEFSRASTKGNYCALHVETEVQTESERNNLYIALKSSPSVKMIL